MRLAAALAAALLVVPTLCLAAPAQGDVGRRPRGVGVLCKAPRRRALPPLTVCPPRLRLRQENAVSRPPLLLARVDEPAHHPHRQADDDGHRMACHSPWISMPVRRKS